MFITISEIIDIIFMTFAIGFIFSDIFRREPIEGYDPLKFYTKSSRWENIKFAAIIAAPAVVFKNLFLKNVILYFTCSKIIFNVF